MKGLLVTLREIFRYKGQEGQLAWVGHRLAGIGTVLFFAIHVFDTSWAYFWPEGYVHALDLYTHPLFLIGELLLMLAVIYHAVNGIRIYLMDLRPALWERQRELTLAGFVITAVLYIPAFLIMGSKIIDNL
jgi:succinate dehydrogenase / fumarate reductase cytochrome b subunit